MTEQMKFKFKVQQFQTDAVQSIIDVFTGQPKIDGLQYQIDPGKMVQRKTQLFTSIKEEKTGFGNAEIYLDKGTLLDNIQKVQNESNLPLSERICCPAPSSKWLRENPLPPPCACALDIEMETGTGKTYVYTKTIFELNKRYGWSKFIIVVPSVAIREGVKKSFEITQDHFQAQYQQKARCFIYNSKDLSRLEEFSSSDKIQVMIINMQAFNARGADARKIYEELDSFGSRKPIDVIAANRPILILDEPQKMGGEATQDSLHHFHPLFMLNYSATHKKAHNLVYALDAVDAYNQRLVKKIEVKGFELQNIPGTECYLYLDQIIVSKQAPTARVEFQVQRKSGSIARVTKNLSVGDDLYSLSEKLNAYKNCRLTDIDPVNNSVEFSNGVKLTAGMVYGDISEEMLRRIQIRETIRSHFEKEQELYERGIKTLSLFFIDEVAHYRQYDNEGNEVLGEYGRIFEEEYQAILTDQKNLFNDAYQKYIRQIDVQQTHTGYFSIDKKGRSINSSIKRGSDESDDTSAYDLILKNKEQLLSLDEPVRFIFSHSALREGWDNPNVFQICTLKHGGASTIQKRQEVGRGLRLCVNQNGERMDAETLGTESVFDLNRLTVIASEGYADFVAGLQTEMSQALCARPLVINTEYFIGRMIRVNDTSKIIDVNTAGKIYSYFEKNNYVDSDGKLTPKYKEDMEQECLAPLPPELEPMAEGIRRLVQPDGKMIDKIVENGKECKIEDFDLNENFNRQEFQALWKKINEKYDYRVDFDSDELINKSVAQIDRTLSVNEFRYTVVQGKQADQLSRNALENREGFQKAATREINPSQSMVRCSTKYDLIKEVADRTRLTRRTIAEILSRIRPEMFQLYPKNPEGFIVGVSKIINEQKATMVVEHIAYYPNGVQYDQKIFTIKKSSRIFAKATRVKKNVQNFLFTDGLSDNSVESEFVKSLECAEEVIVYAKLPRGFQIPTPMGNYAPDWAIVFDKEKVKHIFFVAETKGSLDTADLRLVEKRKIDCAKKLFQEAMSRGTKIRYDVVKDYKSLKDIVNNTAPDNSGVSEMTTSEIA